MAASTSSPYDILGADVTSNDFQLRIAYRHKIHKYTNDRLERPKTRTITAETFRRICRAYETLSDHEKCEKYNTTKEWVSNLPLQKYTLQQLAAEPELIQELKLRLEKATLRMMNAQDPITGHTALYCAARACNIDAVYYLTEQGANSDLKQRSGSTALHVSSFYGHPQMVRCLLASGADFRLENSCGNTPETEAYNDSVKQVFIEMKNTHYVQTAADQLDWLKENIHSITHIDEQYFSQRQTLLHCASKKGYLDIVCWLIEDCSANLDIVDINLNSALHLAAYGKHKEVVEYLVNCGANPLLLNKWCMTAEQEGSAHGTVIKDVFKSMREIDMLKMAAEGRTWWFEYYFGDRSPNFVNEKGINLLYIASRYGQNLVVEWLLAKGANVNIKLLHDSQSTPLHGAVYNQHISTVELLLNNGADVNIKNFFGSTPFDDAKTDEIKSLLKQHKSNLEESRFFYIQLYSDGKKAGDNPLATLKLTCDGEYNELIKEMPADLKEKLPCFSIARRPLNFDGENITVLSSACRARHVNSKFIQFPLCLTAHERARYIHSGHVFRSELPNHYTRDIHQKFMTQCTSASMKIRGQVSARQEFKFGDLCFTFPESCATEDVEIAIDYIVSPEYDLFKLSECVCFFITKFKGPNSEDAKSKLKEMPLVSYSNEPNARLYNWISPTSYWFTYRARQIKLIAVGETHAFVRHVEIIPDQLILPPDMFIPAGINRPLQIRTEPVYCRCLKIRQHNTAKFPHIAYHGTHIKAIESILMDGFVMPSTVVSSGVRICPPSNHIARGVSAFGKVDFSNAIFLTPSIHYCSDPTYGIPFTHDDESVIAVLECTLKDKAFECFPCTVPNYVAKEGDDINQIEWRITNPADIEIISVLFIPLVKSVSQAAAARAKKIGY